MKRCDISTVSRLRMVAFRSRTHARIHMQFDIIYTSTSTHMCTIYTFVCERAHSNSSSQLTYHFKFAESFATHGRYEYVKKIYTLESSRIWLQVLAIFKHIIISIRITIMMDSNVTSKWTDANRLVKNMKLFNRLCHLFSVSVCCRAAQ